MVKLRPGVGSAPLPCPQVEQGAGGNEDSQRRTRAKPRRRLRLGHWLRASSRLRGRAARGGCRPEPKGPGKTPRDSPATTRTGKTPVPGWALNPATRTHHAQPGHPHSHAQRRNRARRARKPAQWAMPTRSPPHTRTPVEARPETYTPPTLPLVRRSAAHYYPVPRSRHTRVRWGPRRSLGPSVRGPKLSVPLRTPSAIPKLPGFERRRDASLGSRAPHPPLPRPRAAPPLTSQLQLQIAGRPARRASTGAAAPAAAAAAASYGAVPRGTGAGPRLPDSGSSHWLAAAAPPRPIVARGRGIPPGGLGGARRGAERRV